jgi:hypothetical protein
MKIHTTRPRTGNARRIWDGLTRGLGLAPSELWYNPNNWGRRAEDGWGTWAFRSGRDEMLCGIDGADVYVRESVAPYRKMWMPTPVSD